MIINNLKCFPVQVRAFPFFSPVSQRLPTLSICILRQNSNPHSLYAGGAQSLNNIRLFSSTSTKFNNNNNNFFYSNGNLTQIKIISTPQKIMVFLKRTVITIIGGVIAKCLFLC